MRLLKPLASAAAILLLTALPVMAQTAPPAPPASAATGPADQPAAGTLGPLQVKLIDGPVKKVDPVAKTVQVGWLLGFLHTTLEVTDGTYIAVGGEKASLQDIREGDEVKASYEARDGKYIAKSIEATHAEATGKASATNRVPGPPASPKMMQPKESTAPPSSEPNTQ